MILHFLSFLGVLLLVQSSPTWLHKCWQAVKKKQMCQCKKGAYSCKSILIFGYLLFWQWKGGRWKRRLLKPHTEVVTKTEYIQCIFHSVAPWQTAGRGTLLWQDHSWRRADCQRDHSGRLQGDKCAVTSAGLSDGSRIGVFFRCDISTTDSLYPQGGCSADMPWHPADLRVVWKLS